MTGDGTAWKSLGEIVYVLPRHVPPGWTVKTATERAGRPQSEWDDRVEVLATRERDAYLLLAAHRSDVGAPPDAASDGRGPIQDVDPTNFLYLAYVLGTDALAAITELQARGIAWNTDDHEFSVVHIASGPDDRLVSRLADELANADDLEFDMPTAATAAGFEPVGSATEVTDVPDYTLSWAPRDIAGASRAEAVEAPDEGPVLFVNVGARFYAQSHRGWPTDPADARVTKSDGLLHLRFILDGSSVHAAGRAVDEQAVRALATSLVTYDRDAWRAELGDRLLVDDPE